jgi:RNA polymerase sigma-70 factor (ECF subfamily)
MIDREPDRLGKFQTTSWSLIIAAGQQPTTSAEAALVELCQLYWYPVYVFIRRRGYSKDDASDLTQEFFARLLAKNYLKEADPVRGRFRSFLLACVSHFFIQRVEPGTSPEAWWRFTSGCARCDRGRMPVFPGAGEPGNPGRLYERLYALSLLDQVQASMRRKYA